MVRHDWGSFPQLKYHILKALIITAYYKTQIFQIATLTSPLS